MDCQFNFARPRSPMSVTEMKVLETWDVKLYKYNLYQSSNIELILLISSIL